MREQTFDARDVAHVLGANAQRFKTDVKIAARRAERHSIALGERTFGRQRTRDAVELRAKLGIDDERDRVALARRARIAQRFHKQPGVMPRHAAIENLDATILPTDNVVAIREQHEA